VSYAAAAAASAQVNAQIVPAAAGMSDLLGGRIPRPQSRIGPTQPRIDSLTDSPCIDLEVPPERLTGARRGQPASIRTSDMLAGRNHGTRASHAAQRKRRSRDGGAYQCAQEGTAPWRRARITQLILYVPPPESDQRFALVEV
jgi:hypothetical protein